MDYKHSGIRVTAAIFVMFAAFYTQADSIDPASFETTLELGESVTITKTVTVDDAPPSSGLIDVMFLFDTSGSMGGEIAAAQAAANSIFAGLEASFGSLSAGSGYFSDPGWNGLLNDLTTDSTAAKAGIDGIFLGQGGGGGDFPEKGFVAVEEAANGASWRTGSSRFIIALADANFKESNGSTEASAAAALADNNVTFIGIDYGLMASGGSGGVDPTGLATGSGGSIVSASGLSVDDLVNDITEGVGSSFLEYSSVTVSDLGSGLPGISLSVECLMADGVACSGDTATGAYTREVERIFTFAVTFTAEEVGTHSFETKALVDGAATATESDRIRVPGDGGDDHERVPEPGSLIMFASALIGLLVTRRKKV